MNTPEIQELTVLRRQISTVEGKAEEVTINSSEDYEKTADLIASLKEIGSKIKASKESITKPLNEALGNARDLFRPLEAQFTNAEAILKIKILDYNRRVNEEARRKEAEIAKKLEAGKIKLPTAERKIESIERVETTTRGKKGEVQIRKVKKYRIVDEMLIPREYLVPNEVLIRRDAIGGKAILGVEVYEEEQVAAGSF